MPIVKLETRGDVRVMPCPKCGESLKIANAPPSLMSRSAATCNKCHTTVDVTRKK